MSRAIVLEVNELPRQVLEWWGSRNPDSPLWNLATNGTVTETILDEQLPRDLYPSQSWASVGMGVPWEKHRVFWYGDPKPAEFPFYWQAAAAAGRTVGLVGVLHSSPLSVQCPNDNIVFAVPDCFAADDRARPATLSTLQQLNLRLSRQSARVASVKPSLSDATGVLSFAKNGVRPATFAQLGQLTANVVTRRWNKERLRVGQALLLADVFERQIRTLDPDLAVFFTNHIASAMHRYWAATFPEDWGDELPYTADWRAEHEGELPFAMASLDQIVGRLVTLADATDREVLVVSSMGQKADLTLGTEDDRQAVVRDERVFLEACGAPAPVEVHSAMVPQLTLTYDNPAAAAEAENHLVMHLGPAISETMQSGSTLTLTYSLSCRSHEVQIGGKWLTPDEVGVSIEVITDHRSGRHSEQGLLLSSRPTGWPAEIDAFQVAPLLLEQLDVAPLSHHHEISSLRA